MELWIKTFDFKFNSVINQDYLLISKLFHLIFNIPSRELEVLVVEEVVDETENHFGVREVPDVDIPGSIEYLQVW